MPKLMMEKLDLLIVRKCNLPELMSLFISFLKGIHHDSKHVTYIQARKISISGSAVKS